VGDPAGDDPLSRTYDNARRREQAAATHDRIIEAATQLLRETSIRDWSAVTIASVAERAGVAKRTVYRHMGGERGLRSAVMARFEGEAGVELSRLDLDGVSKAAAQILRFASRFPVAAPAEPDPTLDDAGRRRRRALQRAVEQARVGGGSRPSPEASVVAAVLDQLWSVSAHERLVGDWRLEPAAAIDGLTWAIDVLVAAVRADAPLDDRPTPGERVPKRSRSQPSPGRGT